MGLHPRVYNKPLACQSGMHLNPVRTIINGVPTVYCTKCGGMMGEGFVDGTWSKRDVEKLGLRQERRVRTKEQIMREAWEKRESERKERTSRSIKDFVKSRMQESLIE